MTKVCKKCKIEKDLDQFYLNKENNKPYGKCGECWQERASLLRKVRLGKAILPKTDYELILESGKQRCTDCNNEKILSEFQFQKQSNKYLKKCRECRRLDDNLKRKIHRLNNPLKTRKEITLEKQAKTCSKCQITKSLDNFNLNDNRSDGFHSLCLICEENFKIAGRERTRSWQENNEDRRKAYIDSHKSERAIYMKAWRQENKEHRRIYRREYNRERKKVDIGFRLLCNLRNRLRQAIKNNSKRGTTIKLLGCTIEFLKNYLTSKFTSHMTWENYGMGEGKWSIDHIIPCSRFDMSKEDDQYKCFHYTNLQPLWSIENSIKSDRIY